MKKLSFTLKSIALLLYFSANIYATTFEYHNHSEKYPSAIALGTLSNVEKLYLETEDIPVNQSLKIENVQIDKNDPLVIFLVIDNETSYTFQLNPKPGKNIKVELVLIDGKIDLQPQKVPNNIKKEEMVLIGAGSI